MRASALLIKIPLHLCSGEHTGDGIFEMGKSINVSGMFFPIPLCTLCMDPFSFVAHAVAHQVSDGVICHYRRLVYYMSLLKFIIYFLVLVSFFQVSEKECKPEEQIPHVVTYIHLSPGSWHVKP